MKNPIYIISIISFIFGTQALNAQDSAFANDEIPTNYLKRSAVYDYSEAQLNNTDSIPDFKSKTEPLMITGVIYESDGKTPAKDVIMYISQPDENGNYELKRSNDKRYVYHRGWIKTDADGRYTFYTFVPGNSINNREVKHIHSIIKEPGKPEYGLEAFVFDNDPFLSKSCRKKLAKRGIDNILTPVMKDNILVATKDIILEANNTEFK